MAAAFRPKISFFRTYIFHSEAFINTNAICYRSSGDIVDSMEDVNDRAIQGICRRGPTWIGDAFVATVWDAIASKLFVRELGILRYERYLGNPPPTHPPPGGVHIRNS